MTGFGALKNLNNLSVLQGFRIGGLNNRRPSNAEDDENHIGITTIFAPNDNRDDTDSTDDDSDGYDADDSDDDD